jgi:hypothetical protein
MIFTSALGVALMGLVFYSDHSDADHDAYRAASIPGSDVQASLSASLTKGDGLESERSAPARTP